MEEPQRLVHRVALRHDAARVVAGDGARAEDHPVAAARRARATPLRPSIARRRSPSRSPRVAAPSADSGTSPVRRPATNAVLTKATRATRGQSAASASRCAVPSRFTRRAWSSGRENVVSAARCTTAVASRASQRRTSRDETEPFARDVAVHRDHGPVRDAGAMRGELPPRAVAHEDDECAAPRRTTPSGARDRRRAVRSRR